MGSPASFYRRMIDRPPSNLSSWAVLLLLWPWAQLYRLVMWSRAALYRRGLRQVKRAGVPVISVGNLTAGGTGKTPIVDDLVKRLLGRGLRVAVVSRGYGGNYRGAVGLVATGDGRLLLDAQTAGDEPCLLARRNPTLQVYVARRRARGVRAAEAAGAEVIVLDDGFQHLAVQRDLDIVLLDSRSPFGNGQLLPAGPLRESPAALRRAGLLVMTHADTAQRAALPFAGPMVHCRHRLAEALLTLDGEEQPWTRLAQRPVVAFAGIARPDDFFAALRARGITLTDTLAFNDHQAYAPEQLKRLIQLCDNEKLLVTTEKDAVKLRAANFPCPCLVAPLELEFDEAGELDKALEDVIRQTRNPYHQDTKGTKANHISMDFFL
jgi:tetraacyldisaccharide 4'-kinase